jgi:hypothetical protein
MKKLLYTFLILGSFYSYAQNNVYGKKVVAIDSLRVGFGVRSDGGSLDVDNLNLNLNTISSTSGGITLSTVSNSDIVLTPNGTGKVDFLGIANFNGEVLTRNGTGNKLVLNSGTSGMFLSLHGSTHPTRPNEFLLQNANGQQLVVDAAGEFDFEANSLTDIGSLALSSTQILNNGIQRTVDNGDFSINGGDATSPSESGLITLGGQTNTGGAGMQLNIGSAALSEISFTVADQKKAFMDLNGDWDFNANDLTDIGSLTVDDLTLDASTISSQFATLRSNTPDAADNGQIAIAGGGAIGNGRGAYILLDGNESANDGLLSFVTGDDANALMTFRTGATVTPRLSINASGIFDFNANSLTDIGSLAVDNLTLDLNTLSSTNANGNVVLDPNGTGILDVQSNVNVDGIATLGGVLNNGNYSSTRTVVIAALSTNYTLVTGGVAGIIIFRDNTGGGSSVWLTDPNAGSLQISSNVGGTYSISFTGGNTVIQKTAGSTGITIAYNVISTGG